MIKAFANSILLWQKSVRKNFYLRVKKVILIQDKQSPQGSVLSVTLFSLKINGILNQLPNIVHGNLYVDDLNIFCQGKDMKYIERQLQLAIKGIIAWTNRNDFTFSTDKTYCVNFCRIRGVHPDLEGKGFESNMFEIPRIQV